MARRGRGDRASNGRAMGKMERGEAWWPARASSVELSVARALPLLLLHQASEGRVSRMAWCSCSTAGLMCGPISDKQMPSGA
jgi:hypothetical protein